MRKEAKKNLKEKENLKVNLRRMEERDIPEIMNLGTMGNFVVSEDVVGWTEFWPEKTLENWIKNSNDPLIVAEDKGKIIGFILVAIHHPTGKATIENIFVRGEYRQKGVGTQLLEKCFEELKDLGVFYVCVLLKTDNVRANEFFLKQGFKRGFDFAWYERFLGESK